MSVQFQGKFEVGTPLDFKCQFNCTSSCQNGAIGAHSKIQLTISTFSNDVFLRDYSIFLTVASNIKRKFDTAMAQLESSSEEMIQMERTRKRRRTSKYD